jgi:foldase protein PrsA
MDGAGKKVAYSDSSKEATYEKACEIRELAVSGEYDFAELASRYSEDTEITCSFGKGEMEPNFEAAAFLLETGEVSPVVESESGYHIIKCLNTFDREETDTNKLKILEQRRREAFGQEYDAFVNTLAKNLNQQLWAEVELIHDENVTTDNFFAVYEKYFLEKF